MAGAPEIRFRCTLCAFCCRHYTPLVTAKDARRIQHSTGKPASSFLVFYRPKDFEVPLTDDERLFNTKHGLLAMGLLRAEEACAFLENNLCSIYTSKPGICRAFPFQPVRAGKIDGFFELLKDPCNANNADDDVVTQDSARADYSAFIYDYHDYVEQVRAWNADPASKDREIEDFLQYVGLNW